MTGPRQGFLLLTSTLGDPGRKPLTVAQFRNLAKRVTGAEKEISSRALEAADLRKLGYDSATAEHICALLSQTNLLRVYLRRAENCQCIPITRIDPQYPPIVRHRMGLDSPACLWAKGDVSLLDQPAIAVVGSRELRQENRRFAEEAGRRVAEQGFVLVSGNAKGADQAAQNACLQAGGRVISVVADSLQLQPEDENVLYLSLDAFDSAFSPWRALQRNYVIHSLARLTVAAQCSAGKGGTWEGVLANLKHGWTPVCVFDDGSEGAALLQSRGVQPVGMEALQNLRSLAEQPTTFFSLERF